MARDVYFGPSHEERRRVAGDERCAAKRSTAKPRLVPAGTDVPTRLPRRSFLAARSLGMRVLKLRILQK
jgi:hypothetical protein